MNEGKAYYLLIFVSWLGNMSTAFVFRHQFDIGVKVTSHPKGPNLDYSPSVGLHHSPTSESLVRNTPDEPQVSPMDFSFQAQFASGLTDARHTFNTPTFNIVAMSTHRILLSFIMLTKDINERTRNNHDSFRFRVDQPHCK